MAADVFPAALGHVGDDRRDQRLAHAARDLVGGVFHDELVLAVDHVRALLLGARGADDHVGRAGRDQVADLGPGQLFDEDRVGRLARRRGGRRVGRALRGNRTRWRAATNRCKTRQQTAIFHALNHTLTKAGGMAVNVCSVHNRVSHAPCMVLILRHRSIAGRLRCSAYFAARRRSYRTASGDTGRVSADHQQRQQWLDMFARGYFPGRSGQVFVVPKQGWFVTVARSALQVHARIAVGLRHAHSDPVLRRAVREGGSFAAAAKQQDVAPTVGAMIGASPLPTYTGRVLTEAIAAGNGRPRVVTVMVLDAMRADYFDKYASVMPTLSRMRKEGAWFSNARTVVLPTVTGVGHANIGTGSEPRFHGIVVNNLFNRATGKSQEAYDQLDTRELMALTLADEWNLTTDGKAVIIGQGGAIRATAGLVGRGACLISGKKIIAASYGGADGGWETNPDLLHHARRLEAIRRPQGVGSGRRQVDGPRHRQRAEVPRLGAVSEVRGRSAARGRRRINASAPTKSPISCS